jgi:hypothetical protein
VCNKLINFVILLEVVAELATNECCVICFDEIKKTDWENNTIIKTKCHHYFHGRCGFKWYIKKGTCPTCRKPMIDSYIPYELRYRYENGLID